VIKVGRLLHGNHMKNKAIEDLPDLLDVSSFRREYHGEELRLEKLYSSPFRQFHAWFDEATHCPAILEPTAMVLSTSSLRGDVSSRVVLLKGYCKKGFRFFTNAGSQKALQISENSSVSLLFYWEAMERQIRVNGKATRLTRAETDAYFAHRPRASCISAWASRQSEVLPDREALERKAAEFSELFEGREIPAPDFWGGYLVSPKALEFWQGRPNRLHDRFVYRKVGRNWIIERLSP